MFPRLFVVVATVAQWETRIGTSTTGCYRWSVCSL